MAIDQANQPPLLGQRPAFHATNRLLKLKLLPVEPLSGGAERVVEVSGVPSDPGRDPAAGGAETSSRSTHNKSHRVLTPIAGKK